MIEQFFEQVVGELGVTGLLILGLYFTLGKHLLKMSRCLDNINREIGEIRDYLKKLVEKQNG